jgi:ketosteroid isomerase-like protein
LQGAPVSGAAELAVLSDPRQTMAAFAWAIGHGDRDAAVECFREDGCLITSRAMVVTGHQAIRLILAELFARESRIDVLASSLESARGTAVGAERWRVRSLGPVWEMPREVEATAFLRQVEGAWKLVVATLVPK